MPAKSKKPLSPFARIMRIVLGFLGFGVAVSALFAIITSVNSNFDFRSKAALETTPQVRTRCFTTGKLQTPCSRGYICVGENGRDKPQQGRWGRCVPEVTPKTSTIPSKDGNNVCFGRVLLSGNTYYWPDACKGMNKSGVACAQMLIALTENEVTSYKAWILSGKPVVNGCPGGPTNTPAPTPTPIAKNADCFTKVIYSGGKYYWPNSCKGMDKPGMACAQMIVQLTPEELTLYQAWIAKGKPAMTVCPIVSVNKDVRPTSTYPGQTNPTGNGTYTP
jgi:hypothetical protein